MSAVIRAMNPMKIARAINPVSTGRKIVTALKNPGNEALERIGIEAGKDFAYWFGGLIGIAVGVLNPLLMMRQYKNKGVPEKERNALVVQEAANQAVNVVVHMACYFGLSALVARIGMKIPGVNKDLVDITKILVANIGGFLGQGVVRPILGSTILMKWQDKQKEKARAAGGDTGETSAETPKMQSAPGGPQGGPSEDQMIQELLKSLQQPQQAPAPAPQMAPAVPQAAPRMPAPMTPPMQPPAFPGPAPMAPPPAFPPFAPPPPMPMPANFGQPFPAAPGPNPFVRPYLK